jgi:cell division septum initiation protein DivIVA
MTYELLYEQYELVLEENEELTYKIESLKEQLKDKEEDLEAAWEEAEKYPELSYYDANKELYLLFSDTIEHCTSATQIWRLEELLNNFLD